MVVERYKLPIIGFRSSGDLKYSMVNIDNNTGLYT